MLKEVSNALEVGAPNSKTAKLEATCVNVPGFGNSVPDIKSEASGVSINRNGPDGAVPNGTFYNCTFNLMK
jgi:hypothetical protein